LQYDTDTSQYDDDTSQYDDERLFMKLCLQRRKTKFADYDRTE